METKTAKKFNVEMTTGSITKNLIRFSIPVMISTFLQYLYSSADLAIVGNFSGNPLSLSAVGATAGFSYLFASLLMGFAIGANVVVAQFLGNKDEKAVSNAVHTAILMSVILGVLLTIISVPLAKPLLTLINVKGELLELGSTYITIIFSGLTFSSIYNFGSAILRAYGDSKRPLIFLAISGVINIILNFIFVYFFNMDVAGVALATIISQFVSCVLVIITLVNSNSAIKLDFKKLKIQGFICKRITYIGLLSGIQASMFNITSIFVQSYLVKLGDIYPAANAAQTSISNYVFTISTALYEGTLAFTSQNYGANNIKRIKKVYLTAQALAIGATLVVQTLIIVFRVPLLHLFTQDAQTISIASVGTLILGVGHFTWASADVSNACSKGMNDNLMPLIFTIFFVCVVRVLYLLFIFPIFPTYESAMLVYPISWVCLAIVQALRTLSVYKKIEKTNIKNV